MEFKEANTEKEVDKIIENKEKSGEIAKVDYVRADVRKIELRLRKRKHEEEEEEERRESKKKHKSARSGKSGKFFLFLYTIYCVYLK